MIDANELHLVSSTILKEEDDTFTLKIEVLGPDREVLIKIRGLVHDFIDAGCPRLETSRD